MINKEQRIEQSEMIARGLYEATDNTQEAKVFLDMASCVERYKKGWTYRRCKNPMCMVCNTINQYTLSSAYIESVKQIKKPVFVTLTVPSIDIDDDIRITLNKMYSDFSKIKDSLRKQGKPIYGNRKLEINLNAKSLYFKPHFHLIIDNSNQASESLIYMWKMKNPPASKKAQNFEDIDKNTEKRVLNYLTKPFYNIDEGDYNFDMILQLYRAVKGRRKFQNYGGFKKMQTNNAKACKGV